MRRLVENRFGRGQLEDYSCENNIKMDLKETGRLIVWGTILKWILKTLEGS
jgi:hypothetical protein